MRFGLSVVAKAVLWAGCLATPGHAFAQAAPAVPVAPGPRQGPPPVSRDSGGAAPVTDTKEGITLPSQGPTPVVVQQHMSKKEKESCLPKVLMIGGAALAGVAAMFPLLDAVDGGAEAAQDNGPVPGDIKTPSAAQLECRNNAPDKPGRVVIGFDGLGAANTTQPLKRNLINPSLEKTPRVHALYFSQASITDGVLSDAVRCAYELATKPYKTKSGKIVYNSVTIMGYSYGGHAASQLVETLKRLGVSVDLVATVDPRTKWRVPATPTFDSSQSTVGKWVNFYQSNDLIMPGYPVSGAENIQIGGFHLGATGIEELKNRVRGDVARLPACRASYTRPLNGQAVYSQVAYDCD